MSVHGVHVVRISAAIAKVLGDSRARAVADLRNTLKAPRLCMSNAITWCPWPSLMRSRRPVWPRGVRRISPTRASSTRGAEGHPVSKRHDTQIAGKDTLRQRNLRELRLDQHLYQEGRALAPPLQWR